MSESPAAAEVPALAETSASSCRCEQQVPFPGSPFEIEVTPGPASAITTMVPRARELRGEVGRDEFNGCKLELRSFDLRARRRA